MKTFTLPKQFSLKTMTALEGREKSDITSAVRREVVSSVATLVMCNTMYPTPEHYTTLAQRLVLKYPILVDSYECGCVS